jgi:hypothetical protein
MKTIVLSDGSTTQVSDEDYEYLNQFKWRPSSSSVCRSIYKAGRNRTVTMHREIVARMGLKTPLIDHEDRNWRNNQRTNLRAATKSTNGINRGATSKNLYSSYKGVSFSQKSKKWTANIRKDGRTRFIGEYGTEDEAALAYNHYAKSLFGDFAFLNVVGT